MWRVIKKAPEFKELVGIVRQKRGKLDTGIPGLLRPQRPITDKKAELLKRSKYLWRQGEIGHLAPGPDDGHWLPLYTIREGDPSCLKSTKKAFMSPKENETNATNETSSFYPALARS